MNYLSFILDTSIKLVTKDYKNLQKEIFTKNKKLVKDAISLSIMLIQKSKPSKN